ncbi:MAG: hypothetical protein V4793_00295 [Paraburkholderia tropica]|uniref:hypothetical protein n=1 Tax=Burkholderiaceae TaxID=119060 RepID=UPI0011B51AA1|nr:hypothetical protein [Paraburkholderia tropica]
MKADQLGQDFDDAHGTINLCFSPQGANADGDNLTQHRPTHRGTDDDAAVRDVSGVEAKIPVTGHAVSSTYGWAFLVLCGIHAFAFFAAVQLPLAWTTCRSVTEKWISCSERREDDCFFVSPWP